MKNRMTLILAGLCLAALAIAPSVAAQDVTPDEARAIAEEAYIFAYPMLDHYSGMYISAIYQESVRYHAPLNQYYHYQQPLGPDYQWGHRPNTNLVYSYLFLDLRTEPVVITVPQIEAQRYYVFQLVDMYTHNFAFVGTRTTGNDRGNYLLAGPGWKGDKPEGIDTVLYTEGDFPFILARTEIKSPDDLPNVHAIQEQYQCRPLSSFIGEPAPPPAPEINFPPYDPAEAQSAEFIGYFNFLLGQLEVHPSEQELIAGFGKIGIGPGWEFDPDMLDPEIRQAIEEGVASGQAKIEEEIGNLGTQKNGWILLSKAFGNRERMQGRYLTRAAAAMWGIWGNDDEETLYPSTYIDVDGDSLDATRHDYVVNFASDEIPPVNCFWSITMYNLPEQNVIANPIDRYNIGSQTQGLKYGKDGSLTIYIQHSSPGKSKESNWLPAPDDEFTLTLRMYLPKPEALDPLYAPPPVQKAK